MADRRLRYPALGTVPRWELLTARSPVSQHPHLLFARNPILVTANSLFGCPEEWLSATRIRRLGGKTVAQAR